MGNLESYRTWTTYPCKDTDKKNLTLETNIAKAIAGDEKYGDDSALYEGTGRVRKSQRKTGLKRLKKSGNNND